jgi:regulator of cell morphogenesis and NO signaling
LIDYIVNIHHAYLQQTLPGLQSTLTTFIEGHKKKFPELVQVLQVFTQLSTFLLTHNENEEATTFPYLKQIINTYRRKETYGSLFIKTMRKPLHEIIDKEHRQIMQLLIDLRTVTVNYTVPEHACTNYQVILHKLKELDADLVQHKHLENNILFPKVMEMEKELLHL